MKCKLCGTRLAEGATKCPVCGASVSENGEATTAPVMENINLPTYKCPSCKADIVGEHRFCPSCGVNLQEAAEKATEEKAADKSAQEKKCPSCGAVLQDGAKFCPDCGARLGDIRRQEEPTRGEREFANADSYQSRATSEPTGQYATAHAEQTAPAQEPQQEQKKDSFSFGKKFFLLLTGLGYIMPIYKEFRYWTDSDGIKHYYWQSGGGFEIVEMNEDIPYSLLLTASVICAALALISAIAYKVGKNSAIKSLSTSMHFMGFIFFLAWVVIRGLNDVIWGILPPFMFTLPGVYVMLAGYVLSGDRSKKKK